MARITLNASIDVNKPLSSNIPIKIKNTPMNVLIAFAFTAPVVFLMITRYNTQMAKPRIGAMMFWTKSARSFDANPPMGKLNMVKNKARRSTHKEMNAMLAKIGFLARMYRSTTRNMKTILAIVTAYAETVHIALE